MAELSYLLLKNDSSGEDVPGDPLDGNYDGHIEIVEFDQESARPSHPQTGQITGETAYGSINIVKPIDQASPLLQQGLAAGNKFSGQMKFLRTGKDGKREHWYTIEFSNASLVSIKNFKPMVLSESEGKYPDLERISFRFVRIVWRHEKASKEASADWSESAA